MIPIIDGHLDLAWNAVGFERDLTRLARDVNAVESNWQDSPARGGTVVTLEEMRRGNVWLGFGTLLARAAQHRHATVAAASRMNLDFRHRWGAYCAAHAQLAWYRAMQRAGEIRLITTAAELDRFWQQKRELSTSEVGIILVMEGADPVADLSDLDEWYAAGLRQINLVHYGANRYAAGTGAEGGLTNEGRALLDRCAALGIALDTTHLSDQAFFEATERFAGPLLASHQNCRALVSGVRQFTDEQLQIVMDRGGVIGCALDNWMLIDGWQTGVTPRGAVSLARVTDHIDHLCQLAGGHHAAAIGTDLDGGFGREQAPNEITTIGDVQQLADLLAARNYSDEAIEAVFHGNWLRWLRSALPPGSVSPSAPREPISSTLRAKALASDRLVVVVGAGSIGERHARCFARTGRVRVALCDVSTSRLDEVADRLDVARRMADFQDVLDGSPAAVVIATPAPLHVVQARELVSRAIPVLVEKPLSTSMEGIDELIALAEQQQVAVAVAYVLRCHPVIDAMRVAVTAGEIGRPQELVLQSGQCFPFYRPAYRETYYARRATGGGAIQDALTHFLNAAEWIVGPVTQVQADAQRLMLEGVEGEDTVHVLARHGEVLSAFALNQHQAANESTLTIVGTQGVLKGELHTNTVRLQKVPQGSWTDLAIPGMDRDDLFVKQANYFLDCVDGSCPPLCSLSEAASTLATQLAILRASDAPSWSVVSPTGGPHDDDPKNFPAAQVAARDLPATVEAADDCRTADDPDGA